MVAVVVLPQAHASERMFATWAHTFPPLAPLELGRWLLETHTGHMFAHPAGGGRGASTLTSVCSLVGVAALWRRGAPARVWLALLLAPFALNLFAACLHAYPYGGSARWMLHLAPAVCLLAGLGAYRLLGERRHARAVVLALLVAQALFLAARDVRRPYKNAHDRAHRDFARSFSVDAARDAELVWGPGDLGLVPSPLGRARWHARMRACYELVGSEQHDIVRRHKSKQARVDRVEVLEFVPRR